MLNITGSNFGYQHMTMEYFANDMESRGLSKIELWGISPHLDISSATAAEIEAIRRVLQAHSLELHVLTPEQVMYPINIASASRLVEKRSVQYFERAVHIASDLGSKYVFLTPGRGPEDRSAQEAWKRSVQNIGHLVQFAAERKLRTLFEPLPRTESNIVNTVAQVEEFLNELQPSIKRHMGLVLDTVCMADAGNSVSEYFDSAVRAGVEVEHVHIVDGNPRGHLVWGDGSLDLNGIVREIDAHSFQGFASFEFIGDLSYALYPSKYLDVSLEAMSLAFQAS